MVQLWSNFAGKVRWLRPADNFTPLPQALPVEKWKVEAMTETMSAVRPEAPTWMENPINSNKRLSVGWSCSGGKTRVFVTFGIFWIVDYGSYIVETPTRHLLLGQELSYQTQMRFSCIKASWYLRGWKEKKHERMLPVLGHVRRWGRPFSHGTHSLQLFKNWSRKRPNPISVSCKILPVKSTDTR